MSKRSAANKGSCPSAGSAFHLWWQDEGIAETIDIDDDRLVLRIRGLCKIAWSNGEYKAREYDMSNDQVDAPTESAEREKEVAVKAIVRKSPIRRAVFNPRNSTCGSARVEDLSAYWWWTDNSDTDSLYVHACRWSDRTHHRVWPRPIPGYACKRLEMQNRMEGAKLFWLYDANAESEGWE